MIQYEMIQYETPRNTRKDLPIVPAEPPKVLPKKESVRITLPPAPSARIAILSPSSSATPFVVEFPTLVYNHVYADEKRLRERYGVDYIAFSYEPQQRQPIRDVASHEDKATLQSLVAERYLPAHPTAEICINTIDGILYPDAFREEGKA